MILETLQQKRKELNFTKEEILALPEASEEATKIINVLNVNKEAKKIKEKSEKLSHFDNILKSETYLMEDIKEVCEKYDMRFTRISNVNTHFPEEVINKISAFLKKAELPINILDDNIFILYKNEEHPTPKDYILYYVNRERDTRYRELKSEDNVVTMIHNEKLDISNKRKHRWIFSSYAPNESVSNLTRLILTSISSILVILLSLYCFYTILFLLPIFGIYYLATTSANTYHKYHRKLWEKDY